MKKIDVETSVRADKSDPKSIARSITLPFWVPETVDEACNAWGENVVLGKLLDSATIQFQARVRTLFKGTKKDPYWSDADIREEMDGWEPILGRESDPVKKAANTAKALASLPAADQLRLLMETAARLGMDMGNIAQAAIAPVEPVEEGPATEEKLPVPPVPTLVKARNTRKRA